MGVIGGEVGYRILKRVAPDLDAVERRMDGSAYEGSSKLEKLFGPSVWNEILGRTVLDYGCGLGTEAIEMAQRGARHVIGLDRQASLLAAAREAAERANVADRCVFTTDVHERADTIVTIDTFEHFDDPLAVLLQMRALLTDNGKVLVAFGPPWYHPLGGHLFSVFPWAHLLFTEQALIRWRSDFKNDGATRFGEVAGGLNQMSIARFESVVRQAGFRFERFEVVPIRRLRFLGNRLTREWTTATIRCTLAPSP